MKSSLSTLFTIGHGVLGRQSRLGLEVIHLGCSHCVPLNITSLKNASHKELIYVCGGEAY